MSTSADQNYPYPQQSGPQQPYNPYGQPPQKNNNVLGIIALVIAALGLIFACIPGALILGWVLLPIGFILGVISLFLRDKSKWAGLTAIIVSVVGTIVGVIVFIAVLGSVFDDESGTVSDASAAPSSNSSTADDDQRSGQNQQSTGTPHFGQKYEWDNGLALTVSEPQPFTPSEYARTDSSGSMEPLKFTVTVHNGTDEPIDASGIISTALSGGKQAELIFDSANGIVGIPDGKVQPGKELNFDIAFEVTDPSDISIDFSILGMGNDLDLLEVTFVS